MNSRRTVSFQFSVGKGNNQIELHKNFNKAKNTHQKLARIELGTF